MSRRARTSNSAIVRLPVSYQVNDQERLRPPTKPAREGLGLPAEGFVFCGFCQPIKLSPAVFDVWMRILVRAPGSVLWLLEDNRFQRANLMREAQGRNVDPQRLIFAPRVDQQAHIARHQTVDLLLDTWPCGAHTSTSDALWVGVPVITRPGVTFASRVAASLLHAIGLPELIVTDLQAYEDLAVELAARCTWLVLCLRPTARLLHKWSRVPDAVRMWEDETPCVLLRSPTSTATISHLKRCCRISGRRAFPTSSISATW